MFKRKDDSKEEANNHEAKRHQEAPKGKASERPETKVEPRLRGCIPYDFRLRGLLYNKIIEIEADLEECSKDSSRWEGRIQAQKKNLDISKHLLEKCKPIEEIYLTDEERSWLLRCLREVKDNAWYFIAESMSDEREVFIDYRFYVDNLRTIHKYLKIMQPDYCPWGSDVSLEGLWCHRCRNKAEVIERCEPHKPMAYCKKCKHEVTRGPTNKYLEMMQNWSRNHASLYALELKHSPSGTAQRSKKSGKDSLNDSNQGHSLYSLLLTHGIQLLP